MARSRWLRRISTTPRQGSFPPDPYSPCPGKGSSTPPNTLQSGELYGFATIKTDKADYPPGTTVNITGSGWQPNETVALTLVESPLIDTHGPYPVQADASGNISDSSFTTDIH